MDSIEGLLTFVKLYDRDEIYAYYNIKDTAGNVLCYRCRRTKAIFSTPKEGPPICRDCFDHIRREFIKLLGHPDRNSEYLTDGFHMCRMIVPELYLTEDFLLMSGATVEMQRRNSKNRNYRRLFGKRPAGKRLVFELYDLAMVNVPEPMIVEIDNRILEFTPGTYFLVKDDIRRMEKADPVAQ